MMKRLFIIMMASLVLFSPVMAYENTNPSSPILIFVSFSMPRQSLEAYLRDAKKINASIIVRGLINNSFKETFAQISSLIQSSHGDGMSLNPLWFERFGITKVPAVVVLSSENGKSGFDVITGDIPLTSALREIRDHGKSANDIAGVALSKMESVDA